jgi:hypothetical protein
MWHSLGQAGQAFAMTRHMSAPIWLEAPRGSDQAFWASRMRNRLTWRVRTYAATATSFATLVVVAPAMSVLSFDQQQAPVPVHLRASTGSGAGRRRSRVLVPGGARSPGAAEPLDVIQVDVRMELCGRGQQDLHRSKPWTERELNEHLGHEQDGAAGTKDDIRLRASTAGLRSR